MNKQFSYKIVLKIILIFLLTGCTSTSYIKDKKAALLSKERAYTNNSQVNTSFTITMGEREFILAERDIKSGKIESSLIHFRKAKDFYDDAYISSFIFQRNWTLDNSRRILELKEKQLLISKIFATVYSYISEASVNKKPKLENIEEKFIKLKTVEMEANKILNNSDNLLQKALNLSIKYNMFKTKYTTLDAMKETDKALEIVRNTVNELFPDLLAGVKFDK